MLSESSKPCILAFLPGKMSRDVVGSTRYHLWSLARRGWQVVTVDPPHGLRLQRAFWKDDKHALWSMIAALTPPFAVSRTVPGLGNIHRNMTASRLWSESQKFLSAQNLNPDFVWLGAPWHGPLARRAKETGLKTVHHVYDELSDSSYLRPHQQISLKTWEDELLNLSDLVVCSSKPQMEKRQSSHSNVQLLENAVSDDFNSEKSGGAPVQLLKSIQDQPTPRFVYGGVIDHRCDGEFFRAIAESPQCGSLILLGNKGVMIDPVMQHLIDHHPKVWCSGRVAYQDYPSLYQHADVCLLGHRINDFTRGMFPEKILEYLACGKPVISVPLSEVERINSFSESGKTIRFLKDLSETEKLIGDCLSEDSENLIQERLHIASQNTWSVRAKQLEDYLEKL